MCARLGLRPEEAEHPGDPARPPRGVRRRRWPSPPPRWTRSPPRSGTWRAPRSGRCRSRSPRGRRARAPCRTSGTRSSRERVSGLARVVRGYAQAALEDMRALARARHLALVGRARDPARRDGIARLHAERHGVGDGGTARRSRADAREPGVDRRPLLQPEACCWRSSITGWPATTRTRSCSERPPTPGSAGCSSASGCGTRSPTPALLSRGGVRRRCSSCSRTCANLGGVFERLEKLPVEEA